MGRLTFDIQTPRPLTHRRLCHVPLVLLVVPSPSRLARELRRDALGYLHLRSPWVGNERDAHRADEVARGQPLSDGDTLGFHPFEKLGQILDLEADVIERAARSGIELCLALRHRETHAGDIDAIDSIGRGIASALSWNATQDFRVPSLHCRNVLGIKVNVIYLHGHLE